MPYVSGELMSKSRGIAIKKTKIHNYKDILHLEQTKTQPLHLSCHSFHSAVMSSTHQFQCLVKTEIIKMSQV